MSPDWTSRQALGCLAGTTVAVLLGLALMVVTSVKITETDDTTACANNLRQIGTVLVANVAQRPWPSGPAPDGPLGGDFRWDPECFACPADPAIDPADAEWLRRIRDAGPDPAVWPADLTSYAWARRRAPPLHPDSDPIRPLACDRRLAFHEDGINVLYEDGKVEFLDLEKLAFSTPEGIEIEID